MRQLRSQNCAWRECKYHIAFIPKHRRKSLFGQAWRKFGEVSRRLARQKWTFIKEAM
jgi:REP element-mobilizing transposase RayT